MENVFKKAQSEGIALEKRAAVEEIKEGSIDTAPDTHYYERSKASSGLDLTGAINGLMKLSENYTRNSVREDFVDGKLAAQTGEALEEGASPWTERGYKSFQMSTNVNKFVGDTISNMDKFAETSPADFKAYLSEAYKQMDATEKDEFLKEQLSKMYTNVTGGLIKEHTAARNELHQQQTINAARENIVTALHSNGGKVDKKVLATMDATKKALPDKVAYGVIADASYVSMIANGDVSLYEHLRDNDYFKQLDEPTRTQLDRAYLAIKKSKEAASKSIENTLNIVDLVQAGGVGNNGYLTAAEKNHMMDVYFEEVRKKYPPTVEGTEAYLSDIIETSIKNNWYGHGGAKTAQSLITNPVTFVDGKPVVREESMTAIAAFARIKQKYGAKGDIVLSKFLDEDSRAFLDLVDSETTSGIAAATEGDLRTAINRVYDSWTRKEEINPSFKSFSETPSYKQSLQKLSDNIKDRYGDGLFSRAYTWFRASNDRIAPWNSRRQDMGWVTDTAQLRGLEAKNPDVVKDAFDKQLFIEMGHSNNPDIAAKFASNKVAKRTHNILGNFIIYDDATTQMEVTEKDEKGNKIKSNIEVGVSLPQLFGLDAASNDDDVSEALGKMLLDTTEGKMHSAMVKHLLDSEISINSERQTLRIKFTYDSRSAYQALWLPFKNMISSGTSEDYEEAELAKTTPFDLEIPISKIREYNIAKLAEEK